jgi:hypothetical protein
MYLGHAASDGLVQQIQFPLLRQTTEVLPTAPPLSAHAIENHTMLPGPDMRAGYLPALVVDLRASVTASWM